MPPPGIRSFVEFMSSPRSSLLALLLVRSSLLVVNVHLACSKPVHDSDRGRLVRSATPPVYDDVVSMDGFRVFVINRPVQFKK